MKTVLFSLGAILFANLVFSQNIYTTNGTLGANRTVTLNGKTLNFTPATPNVGNFFINGTTGNIGLGTTSPTSRFQMNSGDIFLNSTSSKLLLGTVANFSDASLNWSLKSDRPFIIANATYPLIELRSTSPTAYGWADFAVATGDYYFSDVTKKGDVVIRGYTTGSLLLSNDASGDIKFATKANQIAGTTSLVQMIIDKNGNIGMGTTTPDAKLAVNGIIHTKEVKVDLVGWPDYVFEKEYDLPTLEEVEKNIAREGHLINIPSADEVAANGVLLGDMNKKLLEKVEELTLYIIQMNKELQEVKSQLKKD
jgi:hypothetical protein